MFQANQLRNRKGKGKGKSVSFEEKVSTQAGPSSSALTPAAWSSSIYAAPVPATQAGPTPSIQVTPALQAPLSIYRPASRDYPGPPSAIQAAFAAAPKPKSFLELISQTEAIVGANSRGTPLPQPTNPAPVSYPANPSTGMRSAAVPAWPTDIITPPLEPAFPAYRSAAPMASGYATQPVGPPLPAVSSASTSPSGRSTPHLGSGLFASSSIAPVSSLYGAQFAGPTLPGVNYAATVSSGRSTLHLGSGLSASSNAAAATSPRLAQVFGPAAHPYQPNPYDEPGTRGPESDPRNQYVGFAGPPSYQPIPYDARASYQQVHVGYGGSFPYNPGRYGEHAAYGQEPAQYGQPAAPTVGYQQPPSYDARQLHSPSPEQPGEDSGSVGSDANQPTPYELRETYEPEPDGTAAAKARLKKAENDHALSLLRLQIRRQQLQNEQQTQRLQQEEERQWRLLDQREAKNSRRR